jgi:hypothetical protein
VPSNFAWLAVGASCDVIPFNSPSDAVFENYILKICVVRKTNMQSVEIGWMGRPVALPSSVPPLVGNWAFSERRTNWNVRTVQLAAKLFLSSRRLQKGRVYYVSPCPNSYYFFLRFAGKRTDVSLVHFWVNTTHSVPDFPFVEDRSGFVTQ